MLHVHKSTTCSQLTEGFSKHNTTSTRIYTAFLYMDVSRLSTGPEYAPHEQVINNVVTGVTADNLFTTCSCGVLYVSYLDARLQ